MSAAKPARGHVAFKLFLGAWLLAGIVAGFLHPPVEAVLIAFNFAALIFYAVLFRQLRGSDTADIRRRAASADAGRGLFLLIMALVVLVQLVAITAEVTGSKAGPGETILGVLSLIDAWVFANMTMTLHYAHLHYEQADGKDRGGLEFPRQDHPGYWDFAYYAFTIGMTFQTSDVDTTTVEMRRLTLLHALGAFLFNVGAIALSVNILAGSG